MLEGTADAITTAGLAAGLRVLSGFLPTGRAGLVGLVTRGASAGCNADRPAETNAPHHGKELVHHGHAVGDGRPGRVAGRRAEQHLAPEFRVLGSRRSVHADSENGANGENREGSAHAHLHHKACVILIPGAVSVIIMTGIMNGQCAVEQPQCFAKPL